MFKKIAGFVVAVASGIGSAFAAVPTNVSTAMTDGAVDAAAVAALALLVVIGVAVVKYMRRAV